MRKDSKRCMMTDEQRAMAEKNMPFVYWYMNKHNLAFDVWEDVLLEQLCRSVMKFEEERGLSLLTFLTKCFENRILMEYRKETKKSRVPEHLIKSGYEVLVDDKHGHKLTLFDMIEDRRKRFDEDMCTEDAFRQYMESIDDRSRTIILMRMQGANQNDIAENLGVTQSYVSRLEKNVLRRLKERCFTH